MTDFDAILFDAGGVLVVPMPSATAPALAPFGGTADEGALVRAHFAGTHAMDRARSEGDQADWESYHRAYAAAAGVPADRVDDAGRALLEGFDHWMWAHPVPGARDALAGLAERGIPIGIVSNAAGQVEGDLARLGICRRADGGPAVVLDAEGAGPREEPVPVACVVDSHVVGVSKPDPAIFAHAFDVLDLTPSARVGYVGDTVFYDVRAAAAAGLTPLLHDPYGFHAADPHPSGPHRTLTSLAELLELV